MASAGVLASHPYQREHMRLHIQATRFVVRAKTAQGQSFAASYHCGTDYLEAVRSVIGQLLLQFPDFDLMFRNAMTGAGEMRSYRDGSLSEIVEA